MGTLCKNCPCRGLKTETDSCMTLFAKKYHNSCVTYDITEHKVKQEKEKFMKELEEFANEKKTIINNETAEVPTDDVVNTQEAQKKTTSKTIKIKKVSKPRKSREDKKTKETKKETEIKNIETKDAIAEIVGSLTTAAVAYENNNNQTE